MNYAGVLRQMASTRVSEGPNGYVENYAGKASDTDRKQTRFKHVSLHMYVVRS